MSLQSLSQISIEHYLILSSILFSIGLLVLCTRKNLIVLLMGVELMLNAVNLSFIAFGHYNQNIESQVMVFLFMSVAAAEAGVGLALVVALFKKFNKIEVDEFNSLRG